MGHQQRDKLYSFILESALDYAIITTDMQGSITSWNGGAKLLFGWHEDEIKGQKLDIVFTDEDCQNGLPQERRAMAAQHRLDPVERWHKRKDGTLFWASGDLQLLVNEAGEAQGYLKIVRDRTLERRKSEALRESEERLRLAQEAGGIGAFSIDYNSRKIETTPQFCRLLGIEPTDVIDLQTFADCLVDHTIDIDQIIERALQNAGEDYEELQIRRRNDDVMRWIGWRAETAKPVDDTHTVPDRIRLWGVIQDVSERRAAIERQTILAKELIHRVKNILSIVQSLANQTMNNASSMQDAKHNFETRIAALAQAQDVLSNGVTQSAQLDEIVHAALETHTDHDKRFVFEGPSIALSSQAALSMALAINELATNSLKYGALSVPQGQIKLHWYCKQDKFYFTWQESHGPKVELPSQRSFGSKLIEQVLPLSLNGNGRILYNPDGVRFELEAPSNDLMFPDEEEVNKVKNNN